MFKVILCNNLSLIKDKSKIFLSGDKEIITKVNFKLKGVENGLRLTLNIEQYEYMPGPHDAAGIKMLLHDRDEIPRVHALGQAIPPGSHVFVGVKIVEVTLILVRNIWRFPG